MIDTFITVWLLCGIVVALLLLWLVRHDFGPRDFLMGMVLFCAGPISLLFMASMVWGDDGEDEE